VALGSPVGREVVSLFVVERATSGLAGTLSPSTEGMSNTNRQLAHLWCRLRNV